MKNVHLQVCFLAMIAAACAAASCQIEETDNSKAGGIVGNTPFQEIVLDAHQDGDGTRTELGNETAGGACVLWSPGDAISIICGGRISRLESVGQTVSDETTFTGNLAADVSACHPGDVVWGVYPHSDQVAFENGSVMTVLPSVQTAKAGSFASNLMILLGKAPLTSENLSQNPVQLEMDFKNVCSGIRFKVTGPGIRTVRMSANNHEALCGTIRLGMDENEKPTYEIIDPSSVVELQAPDGETLEPGIWYYLVTLPVTLSQGATFTVTTYWETGSRSIGTSGGFTLERKSFRQITDLDGSITLVDLPFEVQVAAPDSWVGEDELGRILPSFAEAGAKKENPDRQVLIFYSSWHCDSRDLDDDEKATQVNYNVIFNVAQRQEQYPGAFDNSALWSGDGLIHVFKDTDPVVSHYLPVDNTKYPFSWGFDYSQRIFWGTPLFGYYRTTDPWVLRKHAEMLGDAGVDAVAFDCTNAHFLWEAAVDAIITSWTQAKLDGVKAPKLVFILNFAANPDAAISLRRLYSKYYSNPAYADMWFHVDGKPLIMAFPQSLETTTEEGTENDAAILNLFTFRPGQADYVKDDVYGNQWGWMQTFYGDNDVKTFHGEEITVSVAQNASDHSAGHCFAFNSPDTYGRSYTHTTGQSLVNKAARSYIHGYNFQDQWDNALGKDNNAPIPYVFVTGWNEWIAGMQYMWPAPEDKYNHGEYGPWGIWGPPAFADQYDWEHSRDIEPTLDWGDDGDNYYYQLAKNIRMYKGVSASPRVSRPETMAIDGDFTGWDQVSPDFKHYPGNTLHRDHQGHTEHELAHYKNSSGRNDFVDARVTRDNSYVYFYVETAENITTYTDARWMRLLINKDMNWSTGWKGYDYCLNFETPASATQGYISQCTVSTWTWTRQGTYDYRIVSNKMELRIPRSLFPSGKLNFAFKWADNNLEEWGGARETRILNLYVDGDAAPGGRFNFHYVEP